MSSIRVFDDIQREDAEEQAKAMRGSDQPLNECIQFGGDWARKGYGYARDKYEATRARREFEESIEEEDESA